MISLVVAGALAYAGPAHRCAPPSPRRAVLRDHAQIVAARVPRDSKCSNLQTLLYDMRAPMLASSRALGPEANAEARAAKARTRKTLDSMWTGGVAGRVR